MSGTRKMTVFVAVPVTVEVHDMDDWDKEQGKASDLAKKWVSHKLGIEKDMLEFETIEDTTDTDIEINIALI